MAIIQRCLCWNNTRSGSVACGVYTLVLSLICVAVDAWDIAVVQHLEKKFKGLQIVFFLQISVYLLVSILSVILVVGVNKDKPLMLLPWIGGFILFMWFELATVIYVLVYAGMSAFNIFTIVFYILRSLLNVYCVLCVISQYQELRAGRGRLQDIQQQVVQQQQADRRQPPQGARQPGIVIVEAGPATRPITQYQRTRTAAPRQPSGVAQPLQPAAAYPPLPPPPYMAGPPGGPAPPPYSYLYPAPSPDGDKKEEGPPPYTEHGPDRDPPKS
ncbi:PREDICTED: uncharacterized protein LOC109471961 [Branchiostoma belcheri]|uniref:Uncharacterized protein LOC109471961 n=1 Tax=Branchiostoma belcheri TaxID=7741 RepID=A0A6P4YRR5_BRABE|nr:PREDICTED: uncharacterized protein LOC109471961 [Branchiostoma belcheri]KAI8478751.1 hypothetical protein Bbelb_435050 [Branchiostoma belcheri]KAI8479008.1 hypothetical protein Bbelb_432580 [Branchiostoma belcheri]KAI8479255.1 hypothetical protein Bbelb_430150 [Branchiostoma belcheri]